MSQAMRLPEKWFHRGLWLLAVLFAGFLIGLGSSLIDDMPKVERRFAPGDYINQPLVKQLEAKVKEAQAQQAQAQEALEQANLRYQAVRADVLTERRGLENWLATRRATGLPDQDPEVLQRTRRLDVLQKTEREAREQVQRYEQARLDSQQRAVGIKREMSQHQAVARERWEQEYRQLELRVFLYRLLLTLPLLVVATWLLRRYRKGRWWPFIWGFAFFAAYTFFVELVPYLPSYGDYVRYAVGVVLTVLAGRQAILALERYLQRQKQAEALPDSMRRKDLSYDTALARLGKEVCPGCERSLNLKAGGCDFCPHCGIRLFDHCAACRTRKSAFSRFCPSCGTASAVTAATNPESPSGPASTPHANPSGEGDPAPA